MFPTIRHLKHENLRHTQCKMTRLFFTQNQNQEGALLMLDDAAMALGKYRPAYLGIQIEPIYATLQELRPMLVGLAPNADCPMVPFVYPKFEFTRSAP